MYKNTLWKSFYTLDSGSNMKIVLYFSRLCDHIAVSQSIRMFISVCVCEDRQNTKRIEDCGIFWHLSWCLCSCLQHSSLSFFERSKKGNKIFWTIILCKHFNQADVGVGQKCLLTARHYVMKTLLTPALKQVLQPQSQRAHAGVLVNMHLTL